MANQKIFCSTPWTKLHIYWDGSYGVCCQEYTKPSYLGWNGMWKFQFEIPIFTWIHKLEGLGWIYAIDNNGHLYLKN